MEEEQYSGPVTIKQLLEAGAHFGHQTSRWNPQMRRYIFGAKNGVHIIDLSKTLKSILEAEKIVTEMIAKRKSILFVGTKKAAKDTIAKEAERAGEYYVSERWLGGFLTNKPTIEKSIRKLDKIEKRIAAGGEGLTKKELSLLTKEQTKLQRNLSGVRGMKKLPGLIVLVDPSVEKIAIAEAKKLGIPIIAIVDTNSSPNEVDHVIPCNDDSQRSVSLIMRALGNAIVDKKSEMLLIHNKDGDQDEAIMAAHMQEEA